MDCKREVSLGLLNCHSVGAYGLMRKSSEFGTVFLHDTALCRAYYFDVLFIRSELSNAKMIRTLPESVFKNHFIFVTIENDSFIALTGHHWHDQAITLQGSHH